MIKASHFGRVIGLALALMGSCVLLGWLLRIPVLIQFWDNTMGMVVNSAACFVLLGLALALPVSARTTRLKTIFAAAVIVVGLGAMLETLFSASFGIDWTETHAWLMDKNPNPGRMSLNTAFAFLCAGMVTILLPRIDSKFKAILVQVLTFAIMLLGLTGFVGTTLQLNLLYSSVSTTQMAFHTSLGMTLLGLGLWSAWRKESWYSSDRFFADDEKIVFVSSASLIVIALTAGIAGFAGQQAGLEKALTDRLPSEFRSQTTIFHAALDRSLAEANSIARRPNLLRLTGLIPGQPADPALRAELDRIVRSAIDAGASAIRIVGLNHDELSRQGKFVDPSRISFTFKLPFHAALIWDEAFYLDISIPLRDAGKEIGLLHIQQPLTLLTRQMTQQDGLGSTGEMGLCFSTPGQSAITCFPQYRNPAIYTVSKTSVNGALTPAALALEGKSGIFRGLDYHGNNVIAVHGPLSDGLALVIKQDTKELLTPIREQILLTGPLLLILVICGTLLLRSQIAPLTSRLMVSERAASDRERRIKALLHSVGEGIMTFNADGVVESFNGAATLIFGHAPEEVIGRKLEMLLPVQPDGRSADVHGAEAPAFGPAAAGKGRVELQGRHRNGAIFQLELTVNAFNSGGERLFVGIVRDVSAQKLAQHRLEEAMEAATRAASAKSIFVANMSHELRTPMNAVLGVAELLSRSPLTRGQRRDLDMIKSAGLSLLGIINNILDFSKIEVGKVELSPSRFNLDEVLRNLASIMSINAAAKNIDLAIGVDLDVPRELYGDAQRLEQVLVNITANAIKFTEQGEVTVRIALAGQDGAQVLLRYSVSDTGAGISEEQQGRLFSPFVQADSSTTRRYGGTGLGLTISKGLVELMGGTISMKSALGEGSTFSVDIPMERAAAAAPYRQCGRLRILLIDDNASSLRCLSDTIRSWDWEVDAVASGREGLKRLELSRESGQNYHVVLADWQMPEMDGLATMVAIRDLFGDATMPIVILITAFGRDRIANDIEMRQPEGMLSKPVTASSLFDTVQEVLAARGDMPAAQELQAPGPLRIEARVLLVEDNAINQFVARSFLEHAGATVEIAENGQVALERLRGPDQFDIVLMDVQMPVMDGFTATRIIRDELHLSIPIIAMTAGVMQAEQDACLAAGMDGFVGKPIDADFMLAKIAELTQVAGRL